jgi:hypothetical protein
METMPQVIVRIPFLPPVDNFASVSHHEFSPFDLHFFCYQIFFTKPLSLALTQTLNAENACFLHTSGIEKPSRVSQELSPKWHVFLTSF